MATSHEALKQAGIALVVIGVLDVGLMIYCVATGQSYSSSLNIFAIVAGVFLIRGHLGAARIVTMLLAFLLSAVVVGVIALVPQFLSLDLLMTELRLGQMESALSWFATIAVCGALAWVYWRLRSPEVLAARLDAGQNTSPPYLAMLGGAAIPGFLALMLSATMSDENVQKAISLAKERSGPGYKYHVTGIGWINSTHKATVIAYNEREIRSIAVQWEQ